MATGCLVVMGRGEEVVKLHSALKRTLEVCYGNCGCPMECLWVTIGGVVSKGDLTVRACH